MTATPERIIVAGDWHGNTRWAVDTVHRASQLLAGEPERIILQLGDFGVWPGETGDYYLAGLNMTCSADDVNVLFLDGNHDDHDRIATWREPGYPPLATANPLVGRIRQRRLHHIPRGRRWDWHGREWRACGGAASPDRAWREREMASNPQNGPIWWPGEYITDNDVRRCADGGHADVVVSHDRPAFARLSLGPWPAGWDVADLARSEHSRDQMQRIYEAVEPSYGIHGHYHLPFTGWETHRGVQIAQLHRDGMTDNWRVLNIKTMTWE